MTVILNRVLSFLVHLVLLVFGLIFTVSLLVAGAMLAVVGVVVALISGRRPVWRMRYGADPRAGRPSASRPGGASPWARRPAGEVIDAEVREISTSTPGDRP